MLDIIIAIFLIYALFAGLVSGINELIAQLIEMRGKVLFEGIAMMLGELPKATGINRFIGTLLRKLGCVKLFMTPGAHLTQSLYDHPLIDTLSQPGSKPSYISPASFSSALVQVLSNDQSWGTLRQKLDDRHSPLGKLLGPMLDEANGDLEKFKLKVEAHYNEVMDRVGGWYKRRTQATMLLIGFVLAVIFNVDSLYILQRLQNDPDLVIKLVQVAEKASEAAKNQDSKMVDPTENENLRKQLENLNSQIKEFRSLGLPIGWVLLPKDLMQDSTDNIPSVLQLNFNNDFVITYQSLQNPTLSWVGWFLTALAGALGAPFWFDALSKLFAIRGTGKKPEESTSISTASVPAIQVIVPPINSTAPTDDVPLNDYEVSRLNGEDIEGLQRALGIPESRINGKLSKELRNALRDWQRITGQTVTGQFDEPTVLALLYPEPKEN